MEHQETIKYIITSISSILFQAKNIGAIFIPSIGENTDFFSDLTYLIIYAFLWNVLIEISLIIIFNFKQHPNYIENHLFINICVIVFQFINALILFFRKGLDINSFYTIMEFILLIMEIVQILFGNKLNKMLLKGKVIKRIPTMKFYHRNLGKLIFIIRKIHLAYYAYYYFLLKSSVSPMLIITLVISFTLVIHGFLFILLHKGNFKDKKIVWNYLVYTSANKDEYLDLLSRIERNEINTSLSDSGLSINVNDTTLDAPLLKPDIQWVLIENRVFEINNLRHPAGNYILKAIAGKDVTREIYGLKSYRFESKEKGKPLIITHRHVPRTFTMLLNYCIGQIKLPELIIPGNSKIKEIGKEDSEISVQLDDLNFKYRNSSLERKKLIYYWTVDNIYKFDKNYQLIFSFKLEENAVINLSYYWLDIFGKYFLIKRENASRDFLYAILSLSPRYLVLKATWYQKLDPELFESLKRIATRDINELFTVNKLLARSLKNKQKKILQSDDDLLTCFLPLMHSSKLNKHSHGILDGENFGLVGPLGQGLGFHSNSTNKIIFIVQDEGILPLVDLIEFLSQRALIELAGPEHDHPIFKSEYLIAYANDIEFKLYWEISSNFIEIAETLSLCALKTIDFAYSRNTLVKQLVKNIVIVNDTFNYNGSFMKSQFDIEVTLSQINQRLNVTSGDKLNRYIISGNEKFTERVLGRVNIDSSMVTIL